MAQHHCPVLPLQPRTDYRLLTTDYRLLESDSPSFRGSWVYRSFDLGNAVGGKSTLFGMLPDHLLVRSDVDTVQFVVGNVAMQPLDFGAEISENTARFL